MLSETCQVCQSTTEQFADSKTEQNWADKAHKWSDGIGFYVKTSSCRPCWLRVVQQAEEIAYRDRNFKDVEEMPHMTRYKYLKQGAEIIGKWRSKERDWLKT